MLKNQEVTTQAKLSKLQQLVTIAITGAMRWTPSKALDAILHLLPLYEFVQLHRSEEDLTDQTCSNQVILLDT